MGSNDTIGIDQFLLDYPGMSICPSRSSITQLKGTFEFQANSIGGPTITDSYQLKLIMPPSFPKKIPDVYETAGKIPQDGMHHVNQDGTLCLGAPVRLLCMISENPTLTGFAEKCIIPFLYSISNKLLLGGNFIFNELEHGSKGVIDDYIKLFGVKTQEQVIQVLMLLSVRRRVANKKTCPFGCGIRIGKCRCNIKLNKYRSIAHRHWFRKHYTQNSSYSSSKDQH